MPRAFDYLYILATIALTVYGQLILKWRINSFGALPGDLAGKAKFMGTLLMDPLIISGFVAAFGASLAWMAAMTKFELGHAYPFMSLNFVVVLLLSALLLGEPLNLPRVGGVALIVIGTIIAARG